MHTGRFDEARKDLASITNKMYLDLKERLVRRVDELEQEAKQ